MVRATYKPVSPDQRLRDLRKEQKELNKAEPGPETAKRLASFVRAAHDERQLNMSMHAAQRLLDEARNGPALLVKAYLPDSQDGEERIRRWLDLEDLARYVDRPDIQQTARQKAEDEATGWVDAADPVERRHRLRTVASVLGQPFADELREG